MSKSGNCNGKSNIDYSFLYQLGSAKIQSAGQKVKNTSSNSNRAANVEFVDYIALDTFRYVNRSFMIDDKRTRLSS